MLKTNRRIREILRLRDEVDGSAVRGEDIDCEGEEPGNRRLALPTTTISRIQTIAPRRPSLPRHWLLPLLLLAPRSGK